MPGCAEQGSSVVTGCLAHGPDVCQCRFLEHSCLGSSWGGLPFPAGGLLPIRPAEVWGDRLYTGGLGPSTVPPLHRLP